MPYQLTHILLKCPIATEQFVKDGYDFTFCKNVRAILYNTTVMTFGKLEYLLIYTDINDDWPIELSIHSFIHWEYL